MAEEPLPSLDDLQRKIDALKEPETDKIQTSEITGFSLAMRLSVELVAGVGIGALLGYGLDRWLDSAPWATAAGVILGAAAGFRNMMSAASRLDKAPDSDTTPHA
jgi:ATP synthase protein I